ncbi:MAG: class I SAM-dependent methyltransferase [Nitrososphaerales archaeon]|nr:class I SAM-dependent methyltransferase [Nitrososphaerales archaeon]
MPGFDRVADIYDATRSLRPDVMSKLVDQLVVFIGRSSVVDFGVGTGRFAAPLAKAGVVVLGLDVSRDMIVRARDKGAGDLVLAASESVPFVAKSFDYVLAVHFIHLVNDWKATLEEMARVSRKGLLTLVEDVQGSHPRDLYAELREKKGFAVRGLKHGERDLVGMVRPSLNRVLVEYTEVFDPAELCDEYAAKLHSITWDMPDSVNTQIVGVMRATLGQKRELPRSVSLVAWGSEELRAFHPSP